MWEIYRSVEVAETPTRVLKFPFVPKTFVPKILVLVPFVRTVVPRFELLAKIFVEKRLVEVAWVPVALVKIKPFAVREPMEEVLA